MAKLAATQGIRRSNGNRREPGRWEIADENIAGKVSNTQGRVLSQICRNSDSESATFHSVDELDIIESASFGVLGI